LVVQVQQVHLQYLVEMVVILFYWLHLQAHQLAILLLMVAVVAL
jgi:hypothetical protein